MIGAVLRRQRDADRGVGRQLMAEALIGLPDRVMDPRDQIGGLVGRADGGLNHGEFVAAEPGDQVALLEAAADAACDRLQQLVADMMSERVVDALELVDVDVEQRELMALGGLFQLALDPLAEQHPVRQVGQRVVMRQMRDLLVGCAAVGDVLDDVEDVAGLAVLVADREPLRGDDAAAQRPALPAMVVDEDRAVGLQRQRVVGDDPFGELPWKQVVRRLADDVLARCGRIAPRRRS